jgi:hypothetical protein
MKTCRVYPGPDVCKECSSDIYDATTNCNICKSAKNRYEITFVGANKLGAYVELNINGEPTRVPLRRIYDIKVGDGS